MKTTPFFSCVTSGLIALLDVIIIAVTVIMSGPTALATPAGRECASLFTLPVENMPTRDGDPANGIVLKHRDLSLDVGIPFLQKAFALRAAYQRAEAEDRFVDSAKITDQIATFAAELIRSHKNQEFFELYRIVRFPLNQIHYEDADLFFPFARNLLEDAILSKNFVVYEWLRSRPEYVGIAIWNQALTEVVATTPHFAKDALKIPAQSGRYDLRLLNIGFMTKRRLEAFKQIQKTSDIQALFDALEDLLPNGDLDVLRAHRRIRDEKFQTKAVLEFKVPAYCGVGAADNDEWLKGDEVTNRWLHVGIFDSKSNERGWTEGYSIPVPKFSLRTAKTRKDTAYLPGAYAPLARGEVNWINELEILPGRIQILIERDREGISFDEGTRFQELTLFYDLHTSRLTAVEISNGNRRIFGQKLGWLTQKVKIPKTTKNFSAVSADGSAKLNYR